MEPRQRIDPGRQSHRPPERLAGLSNPKILIGPDEDRSQKKALHACAISQLESGSVGHAAVISKKEHVIDKQKQRARDRPSLVLKTAMAVGVSSDFFLLELRAVPRVIEGVSLLALIPRPCSGEKHS
ncbi:MAG: hypothetical protein Q9171_001905 [Xanthocarpia ochracea]